RFLSTNLRVAEGNMWWLFQDDPAGARAVAEDALAKWSQRGYQIQHWYGMQALAETDLYEGDASSALSRVRDAIPKMKGALLFRVEMIRALVIELRARCWLGSIGRKESPDLRQIERDAKMLSKHRLSWARPEGLVLLAGVAARRGQREKVIDSLRAAA